MTSRRRRRPRRPSSSAPTAGGRGSPTTSPSRTSGAAPTASRTTSTSRGEQAKGVVIAYDRRFASEHFAAAAAEVLLAHDIPVALRGARGPDPDELVRGRPARRGRRASSSPPATTRGSTTASRSRRRPVPRPGRTSSSVIEERLAANGGHRRGPPAVRRRRGGRPGRALRPVRGLRAVRRGRTIDLDALKAADVHVLVDPMWGAGRGWITRLLAGGRIRVTEIHQERNPYFGGVNPEPIRPNIDEALGDAGRRRLRPGPAPRRRRRPGRRGRRAGHVHPPARRSPGC